MRFVLLALALLAWSGGPMAPSKPALVAAAPALEAVQDAVLVADAEFEALHARARDALDRLRAAQEQRPALADPATL